MLFNVLRNKHAWREADRQTDLGRIWTCHLRGWTSGNNRKMTWNLEVPRDIGLWLNDITLSAVFKHLLKSVQTVDGGGCCEAQRLRSCFKRIISSLGKGAAQAAYSSLAGKIVLISVFLPFACTNLELTHTSPLLMSLSSWKGNNQASLQRTRSFLQWSRGQRAPECGPSNLTWTSLPGIWGHIEYVNISMHM